MKREAWRQVGGDMSPDAYGCVIARFDGAAIELLEIQPTREYVGDREALDCGFPFWSKEARYEPGDLAPDATNVAEALASCDLREGDLFALSPDERAIAVAQCLMSYGHGSEESTAGWAKDVLGDRRVYWWGSSNRAVGWRYLADEDREFRALQREARKAG